MELMKGRVTTKRTVVDAAGQPILKDGKEQEERVILAMWELMAPQDETEYEAWDAKEVEVSIWTLKPPVAVGDNGTDEVVIPEANKVPAASEKLKNFEAWKYGMSLKANGPARKAAEDGVVKDHKITFAGKTTDLDAIQGTDLTVRSINALVGMGAAGIEIGAKNVNVLNSKIAQLVAAGTVTKNADGTVAARKNGGAPVKR
jgi:hypothetical protein